MDLCYNLSPWNVGTVLGDELRNTVPMWMSIFTFEYSTGNISSKFP